MAWLDFPAVVLAGYLVVADNRYLPFEVPVGRFAVGYGNFLVDYLVGLVER